MLKKIISMRKTIQIILSLAIYLLVAYFNVSLLYIIVFGSMIGVITGKIFCRWMCPIGLLMEFMTSFNSHGRHSQLYSYYKLGCPIAWVSGFFNRFSLFKVKRAVSLCTSCGKCDKVCYIASLNEGYSLFKQHKANPSEHYSCSKCLECVKECPVSSLSYHV